MLSVPTTYLAKIMSSSLADNAIMAIGEVDDNIKDSERTVHRMMEAKLIPAFKVGGSLGLSKLDLD